MEKEQLILLYRYINLCNLADSFILKFIKCTLLEEVGLSQWFSFEQRKKLPLFEDCRISRNNIPTNHVTDTRLYLHMENSMRSKFTSLISLF